MANGPADWNPKQDAVDVLHSTVTDVFGERPPVPVHEIVTAGIWWTVFTLVPLRTRDRPPAPDAVAERSLLTAGFRRLAATLRELRGYPHTMSSSPPS